jgi:hypothetical protein
VIHPRELMRRLTLREWLQLGEQVDATMGRGKRVKFDVVKIEREEGRLLVTVDLEGNEVRQARYELKVAA